MDVQGQGDGRIFDADEQRGWEGLENWKIFMDVICVSPPKIYNVMYELKTTEELCLMALKTEAKFEGKLTSVFKNEKMLFFYTESILDIFFFGTL